MKNTEIQYDLSTDYERLYNLLKEGKKVVGFYAYGSSEPDQNYSGLDAFEYSEVHKTFYVGLTIFEAEHTKEEILEFMARWNVIYFPLPESQTVDLPKICSNCKEYKDGKCGSTNVGEYDTCDGFSSIVNSTHNSNI